MFEPPCTSSVVANEDTCMQNEFYSQKPSSKSNSGRPSTGVGNVSQKFPKDQINTWVEYLDLILVCSSGFPFESKNNLQVVLLTVS
jgi:hypothetical protein